MVYYEFINLLNYIYRVELGSGLRLGLGLRVECDAWALVTENALLGSLEAPKLENEAFGNIQGI